MNFSIFENDGTLGELYHAVTFAGNARGSAWMNADAQRVQWLRVLAAAGWGITSLSLSRPSELANDVNFTIVLNAVCDNRPAATLGAGMKAAIEHSGYADRITIRHVRSESCGGNPNLVGGGSTWTPKPKVAPKVTPKVTPKTTTIKGGQLATVDVPISFDDVQQGVGFLDTLKGIDTLTWALIAAAGVLVLKRL